MAGLTNPPGAYAEKVAALRARLAALESVAVAYSGGVDSSVLLHAAHAVLGERAAGVIADSPSLPRRELAEARALAGRLGVELAVLATDEGSNPDYVRNGGDRCYFCKAALFTSMAPWAQAHGFRALAFGEITDDLLDDRPGARAAARFGVVAPLREAGFAKADVRRYAREQGLPIAEKPASACLASRIPVGTAVTPERLARVERAEEALHAAGLRELRVRDRGAHARLEVGRTEFDAALAREAELFALLAQQGFASAELALYLPPAERAAQADSSGAGRSVGG